MRKTSDQVSSAVALASDTQLTFPVVAGVTYAFEFRVVFRSAALTTGIGLALLVPAAAMFTALSAIPIAADAPAAMRFGWLTTSDDTNLGTAVEAINTDYLATVGGQITPSANGAVTLRFRSEVAASAVTVRAGSSVAYQAIP